VLVEFTGCTGSGKSSIATALVTKLKISFPQVKLLDIGGKFSYDFFAIPFFPLFLLHNLKFCVFALKILKNNADSVPIGINLFRNFVKKMAAYESIFHKGSDNVIVWDEGAVHSVHNLLVHVKSAPDLNDIASFAALVPKPDMIIYVRIPFDVALRRTSTRGHRRIKGKKNEISAFIKNALSTFDNFISLTPIKERLMVVENQDNGQEEVVEIAKLIAERIVKNKFHYYN